MEQTRLHVEVASFAMHLPMIQKLVLMWQHSRKSQKTGRGKFAIVNYVAEVLFFALCFLFNRMSILRVEVGLN